MQYILNDLYQLQQLPDLVLRPVILINKLEIKYSQFFIY